MRNIHTLALVVLSVSSGTLMARELNVNAQRLRVMDRGRRMVYTGKVTASYKDLKIRSDVLESVDRGYFVARGHVYVKGSFDDKRIWEGWSEKLLFRKEKSEGVLTGNPRIFYQSQTEKVDLIGNRIVFWENKRKMEVYGRAEATILIKEKE